MTDRPSPEPSSEAARPRITEKDGDAENLNSQPEKTMSSPAEKKESASPPERDEEDEGHSKDCENPGSTDSHDDVLLQ